MNRPMLREKSSPHTHRTPNRCPACQQAIGLGGLKAKACSNTQGKARAQRVCPHCATPLKQVKRSARSLQLALAAAAWVCLMTAGVRGLPATSALAWLGYIGVTAALALQVLAPRWYTRDV